MPASGKKKRTSRDVLGVRANSKANPSSLTKKK